MDQTVEPLEEETSPQVLLELLSLDILVLRRGDDVQMNGQSSYW